ncbi:Cytochrome P450 52A12 [Yarrowia sp. C11]|nr:Cytochrome P450 52A12 [Yarrowia sp. C11]KAG5370910.1 Cytochrome P450 52A12 [Yarrowia sp. E02]
MLLQTLIGTAIFVVVYLTFVKIDLFRRKRKFETYDFPVAHNGFLGWKGLRHMLTVFYNDIGPMGFKDIFGHYGKTLKFYAFPSNTILTYDPDNIKAMLATQFKDFSLGLRKEALAPSLGYGIFTLDGSSWSHSRALLRPQFSREQISRLESVETHVQEMMSCIDKNQGGFFNIQQLFFCLAMDTATEFLLGEPVGNLQEILHPEMPRTGTAFQKAFDRAQRLGSLRIIFQEAFWVVGSLFFKREFEQTNKHIHDYVDQYVDKALQARREKSEIYTNPDKYVFLYELVRETTNKITLRDQVLNILIAGRDTTASTLSWIFMQLASKPEIFHKLRQVVLDEFGTSNENITFESLKKCDYLRQVLNEGLRLHPVVPVNLRVAVRDTTLPRGGGPDGDKPIFVAKGQKVNYAIFWTHRDKSYWGKDAEEFRPERWETTTGGAIGKGWEFLPFNGGPRICLGQQFALTEMGYVITRLCQEYSDISIQPSEAPVKVRHSLTMCSADGINISLTRANNEYS